ncbi:MAG: hypothetical protein Q7R58_00605, partial [bacterium]|nr:hypothetical protein [bacterium]
MLGRASSVERNSPPARAGERLYERRRTRRRRVLAALGILVLILFGALIWGLQQSGMRISRVEILSADSSLVSYATNTMQGNYFGIIPRDSIFYFPEERIRAHILASHNDIAAVSISRNSLTRISIQADYRVPIARWCGSIPQAASAGVEEYCYVFDASGVIFSAVSSTTQTVNTFKLYAPLEGDTEGTLPAGRQALQATITNADTIPTVFDFARQLAVFGSPVISIVIHDGEVDNNLASGTRITYVLGREQDAFTALVSARENFNLADGSV